MNVTSADLDPEEVEPARLRPPPQVGGLDRVGVPPLDGLVGLRRPHVLAP